MSCCTSDNATLGSHRSGDTWKGMSVTLIKNGAPLDLSGARIDMQMRKSVEAASVLYTWSTAIVSPNTSPTIEISAPLDGVLSILKRKIEATSNLVFDIQVTFPNGDVKTVLTGVLPIKLDVTRTT